MDNYLIVLLPFLFLVGVIALYLLFCFLIRQRRFLREKNVLEALDEGIIVCDNKGNILQLNKAAECLLNVSHDQIVGQSVFDGSESIHPVLLDKCSQILKQIIEKKQVKPLSFCIDHEQIIWFTVTAKSLNKRKEVVLFLRENSSHYKIQQVGRDFVANASHELRTPITIIKGFAETVLDLPEISDDMLENFIEKIVRNCHRMENLVKNLLTLADLDHLPLSRMQECDLVALIDSCIHTLLELHGNARVETWYNRDVITVFGDPDLLELAITNLLENGVKYSPSPAHLKVTIEQLPKQVSLSIADCGIGIPSDDLSHIFDRFYTVNKAHSRKLGGAGLGLSIVKTIVAKHNATISVDSKVKEGTSFTLLF